MGYGPIAGLAPGLRRQVRSVQGDPLNQDRPLVLGCRTCGVSERLSLDPQLPERARPFLVAHGECVTFIDLDGASLLEALEGRPRP